MTAPKTPKKAAASGGDLATLQNKFKELALELQLLRRAVKDMAEGDATGLINKKTLCASLRNDCDVQSALDMGIKTLLQDGSDTSEEVIKLVINSVEDEDDNLHKALVGITADKIIETDAFKEAISEHMDELASEGNLNDAIDERIDEKLEDCPNESRVDDLINEKLSDYVTECQLENYLTESDLDNHLSGYVTDSTLDETLEDYVKEEELSDKVKEILKELSDKSGVSPGTGDAKPGVTREELSKALDTAFEEYRRKNPVVVTVASGMRDPYNDISRATREIVTAELTRNDVIRRLDTYGRSLSTHADILSSIKSTAQEAEKAVAGVQRRNEELNRRIGQLSDQYNEREAQLARKIDRLKAQNAEHELRLEAHEEGLDALEGADDADGNPRESVFKRLEALERQLRANPVQSEVPARNSNIKAEITDAGYRVAAKQVTKTIHAPLVAGFCEASPEQASIMELFFKSDLGKAAMGASLSIGATMVADQLEGTPAEVASRLSKELRIDAMAEAGTFLSDLLLGPLRASICEALKAPQTTGVRVVVDDTPAEEALPAEQSFSAPMAATR